MTETATEPLGNSEELRTETGEIKNQAAAPETSQNSDSTPETKVETKPEEKPATAAPEKYEDFKLPEGVKVSDAVLGEATGLFKELGLSQDAAQRLVDFHVKQQQAAADAGPREYERVRAGWRDEIVSDPALGDGKALKAEVSATIGRAIDAMGEKAAAEFREAMSLTGGGDNPAIFRGILALAKLATEGRPVEAKGPAPTSPPGRPSLAKAMYPNLPSSAA